MQGFKKSRPTARSYVEEVAIGKMVSRKKRPGLCELRSRWADEAVGCRRTQSGYDAAGRLVLCYGTPEVRGSRDQLLAPSAGSWSSLVERQTTLSALGGTTRDAFA